MKMAFAGFQHGHINGLQYMAARCEDVVITGYYEENAETRKAMEKSLGVTFNYETYEDLLNDPEVEAVAIGDYFQKRGSMVIAALKKGKHVIADKPLCTDLEELAQIKQLSEEKNLQVGCMLDLRYMNQVEKVKDIIQSGELGKVHVVAFTGQHCLNYGSRAGWYFEEGKHGGTINDLGIHGIDLVRMITGKNVTRVNHAMDWNAFADKEPGFKDCGQFSVMMEDMVVTGDVSYSAPKFSGTLPTYWSFHFWGTKGMLHFNMAESNIIRIYRETEEVIECDSQNAETLNDFLKATKGIPSMLDTASILESQRQVLEIQKAADAFH